MKKQIFATLVLVVLIVIVGSTICLAQETKPMAPAMVTVNSADLKWVPAEALPPGAMMEKAKKAAEMKK